MAQTTPGGGSPERVPRFLVVPASSSVVRPTLQRGPQRRIVDLGVAHRRANVLVSQAALHHFDLMALLQQLGGRRVAKLVNRVARCAVGVEEARAGAERVPIRTYAVGLTCGKIRR